MINPFSWPLDTSGFVPRWHCGHWYAELGWLHIVSDLLVWLAYLAIPAVLVFFLRRRRDLPFPKIFWLFGAFILACGTSHLIEAIIFWHPVYRLAGLVKLATGVVSWLTVFAIVPIIPKVLAMRTPTDLENEVAKRTSELSDLNASLQREVQERLKAEHQVREQQDWFEVVLRSIDEGIIATDVDGQIKFLNPAAEALTGHALAGSIGQPLECIFDAKIVRPGAVSATVANLPPNHKLLTAKDGTRRIVECAITSIQTDGNFFGGAVLTFRDVAERINAESALRESSRRFEETVDAVSDLFAAFDRDWNYIYLNKKAASFTGHAPEDLVGKNIWETFPNAVGGTFYQEVTEAAASRKIRRFEACYQNSRWYEHRAYPHAGGLSLFSTDMTQKKQSEELLRLRDRAINAANQGILIIDALQDDYPIIYASPGFERITGYTAGEVLGHNCRFLQGRETDTVTVRRIREAIRAGAACNVEILNYRKDGRSFWNELSISPVLDDAGSLTHFIGVQADITARRELSEQLRLAQKMESVGRLAGGIAHDFNNMLTVINGCSDIVLKGMPAGDPSIALLREVKNAGERAAGLTQQLLAFSRQQLISPQLLDLNDVINHTETMVRHLAGEDVDLIIALEPGNLTIQADRGQIEQVLVNLVVNSRDAMPRGGRLSISTSSVTIDNTLVRDPKTHGGEYAVLTVEDTGCGFDSSVKDRLFEPFFTTKPKGKGTGLGLPVVHGIVEQAGGFIDVASQPDRGATFKIHLPLIAHAIELMSNGEVVISDEELTRGTETVMIAEDQPGVRAFVREVLARCGYHVLEAVDGNSALDRANDDTTTIHLLVTDVVMPGIGGRELANQFRKRQPGAAVLFISGHTDDAVVRNGILHDKVEFLAKPFSAAALARKVRGVLDRC
jgi:PAS domain S-box-containing protein